MEGEVGKLFRSSMVQTVYKCTKKRCGEAFWSDFMYPTPKCRKCKGKTTRGSGVNK